MEISVLKDELVNDPLTIGYDTMSDTACTNSLNDPIRDKVGAIPSTELLAWAGGGAVMSATDSRYERIETEASTGNELSRGVAKAALQLIGRDATSLDMSRADRVVLVDVLVSFGVLTAAEKDELVALATTKISRAQELGLGRVKVGDVQAARS